MTETTPSPTMLTRSQILAAVALKTQDVKVPEWGGTVRVRELTGRERDEFEAACVIVGADGKATANLRAIRARLVAMAVVGDDGKRLFSADDVEELAELSGSALDRVFSVASKLSGLSTGDLEQLSGN